MARRSLQASPDGIKQAKRAFQLKEWTQEYLAAEVGVETRQPIWKFFTGKPVDRHVFVEICFQLGLDWQDIALSPKARDVEPAKAEATSSSELDLLVQGVRTQRWDKLQDQCGTMRLLDVAKPIELDDIYVNVSVLEHITGQRWLAISDLTATADPLNRFNLTRLQPERVPALRVLESQPKLMILGKPGSGKTTFLQYVAIACNQGAFQSQRVPIFIKLKNFAEDSRDLGRFDLLSFITQEFASCGLSDPQTPELLLTAGRGLILLDGLDEVAEDDHDEVFKQIRKFVEKYYRNQIVISCRTAAHQYSLQGFTEVELADFSQDQIETFVRKWFVSVAPNEKTMGETKAAQFIAKLQLAENVQIRELAVTPILLNLACWVFQIRSDFPARRSDLYEQGLNILLVRWDATRGIKRDGVYRDLSLPHKIKLLSQIAAVTFEQNEYLFEQGQIQQRIADYLNTLADDPTDPLLLMAESEAVLKAIASQHGLLVEQARGIYSFSHLTFQEYFTAKHIASQADPDQLGLALRELNQHITEPRWREVFLLTAGLLQPADPLLTTMQTRITELIPAADPLLQEFFAWLEAKVATIEAPIRPAALRAFYFSLAIALDGQQARELSLATALDLTLSQQLPRPLSLDIDLARALTINLNLEAERVFDGVMALGINVEEPQLAQALRSFQEQIPDLDGGTTSLKAWWTAQGDRWGENLRAILMQHRNIGQAWNFNAQQRLTLQQYYNASKLLVDCLQSYCQVSLPVRQQLEDSLLQLPPNLSLIQPMSDKH